MVELLPDFCHHQMKLVVSDEAVLPGCIFSGRHYKRKSVAFQLTEQKRRKEAFKACFLLSLLLKNITGYLLFPLYIKASPWIILLFSPLCWCHCIRFVLNVLLHQVYMPAAICSSKSLFLLISPSKSTFYVHYFCCDCPAESTCRNISTRKRFLYHKSSWLWNVSLLFFSHSASMPLNISLFHWRTLRIMNRLWNSELSCSSSEFFFKAPPETFRWLYIPSRAMESPLSHGYLMVPVFSQLLASALLMIN